MLRQTKTLPIRGAIANLDVAFNSLPSGAEARAKAWAACPQSESM